MSSIIRLVLTAIAGLCIAVAALVAAAAPAPAIGPGDFGPCIAPSRPLVVAGQQTPVCVPPNVDHLLD